MREIVAAALPSNYVSFRHRREATNLVGTWSASVFLADAPALGDAWSVPGIMEGGIVTSAVRRGASASGDLWDLAGYDAGFRMMKSPPLPHQISGAALGDVIAEVAESVGVPADVTLERDPGVSARFWANGQTAGNAILDLALLGGAVAYMTPEGVLKVAPPRAVGSLPDGLRVGELQARTLDLDGYASGVVCILNRRGRATSKEGETDDGGGGSGTSTTVTGAIPADSLSQESFSGTAQIPGGGILSWAYRVLMPINAVSAYSATLFLPGAALTKVISAAYTYDVRSALVRSDNQEQRIWRWGMTAALSAEISTCRVSYYDAEAGATAEETVETRVEHEVRRTYDSELTRILTETEEARTTDTGAAALATAPPYQSRRERTWTWDDEHRYRGISEVEYSFEERDVGVCDMVRDAAGKEMTFRLNDGSSRYLILPSHQTTVCVRRERRTQTDEFFDSSGDCVTRLTRSTDDNGVAWMLAQGYYGDILDPANGDARAAMAYLRALPQYGSMRVEQIPGGSSLSEEVSTLSVAGRSWTTDSAGSWGANPGDRYAQGDWSLGAVCPFLLDDGTCGIGDASSATVAASSSADASGWTGDAVGTIRGSVESWAAGSSSSSSDETTASGPDCPKKEEDGSTPRYTRCSRYLPYADLVGETTGSVPAVPAVGIAGGGSVWAEKEVYVNADLMDSTAQAAAQTIAENILRVRQASRGLLESVTLPLSAGYHPDGGIISVEHDWGALRTTIVYRPSDAEPPEYLMLLSQSALAANIYAKESVGRGRTGMGQVADVTAARALVILAGRPVTCSSGVRVRRGDNVLVYLPPGSTGAGVIQAVMK